MDISSTSNPPVPATISPSSEQPIIPSTILTKPLPVIIMPVRRFDFTFEPLGNVILPSIRDWDLYQRVITFHFYRPKGRTQGPGVHAFPDELEDTRKVIDSFTKRIDNCYPASRTKLMLDYFINIMNSGIGSLAMARYFGLENIIELRGFQRKEIDFSGCVVACWRRYISALRKEDVKLMVMFFKRIIMPQVDVVFYDLGILNKHQRIVYRVDADDSDSLLVNTDDEEEEAGWGDFDLDGVLEQQQAEIGEAKSVKVDKGKGKMVRFDLSDSPHVTRKRSSESDLRDLYGSESGYNAKKNGESSKQGAGVGNANSDENIENTPVNLTDTHKNPGTVVRTGSLKTVTTQGGGRYFLRSTVNGCKKQVTKIKKKIIRVTGRKLKIKTSMELRTASTELPITSTEHPMVSTEVLQASTEIIEVSTELLSASTELLPVSTEHPPVSTELRPISIEI
ncbi:hypothetical protein TWF281_004349 [Arthrobotrys megalospora]